MLLLLKQVSSQCNHESHLCLHDPGGIRVFCEKGGFVSNRCKQCPSQMVWPPRAGAAVPFQVCPVPTVRAGHRRGVIGVCICVINVQEKGILQNERLFFIISLEGKKQHRLLNVHNSQQHNWNISKAASIQQGNGKGEDKKASYLKARTIYYFTGLILWKTQFPELTKITEVGWRTNQLTLPPQMLCTPSKL